MSSKEYISEIMRFMKNLYQEPDFIDVAKYIIEISPIDKSILFPDKSDSIKTRDRLFYALFLCLCITILIGANENDSTETMH